MDKQEAKMILQAYRPGGQDANDPTFAEALVLVQRDPELGAWFHDQTEMDHALTERVGQAPVPPDLRNAILAGHRSDSQVVELPRVWWKSPALAWAAAIVLLFATAGLLRDGASPNLALAAYRNAMTDHLNKGFEFDVQDAQPANLAGWLSNDRQFAEIMLPADLAEAKSIGCRVFEFESKEAALICFSLPSNEVVHLFVMDGRAFAASEVSELVSFAECGPWKTVSWRSKEQVYLLAGNVPGDKLVQLASKAKR